MLIKTDADKIKAHEKIDGLSLDKPWQIEIKPYKKNRTIAQNKLYWQWATYIGNEIGYTKDEMHAILADMFIPDVFIEYAGKVIIQDKSTSRLNTKEFTEYLEKIDRWAVIELSIVLPSPEDLYYEAMGISKKN